MDVPKMDNRRARLKAADTQAGARPCTTVYTKRLSDRRELYQQLSTGHETRVTIPTYFVFGLLVKMCPALTQVYP